MSAGDDDPAMNGAAVGRALRAIRIRRHRRQEDVARAARVSRWAVARVERGRLDRMPLATVRAVAAALDVSLAVAPRWYGAEIDRLLASGHDALREAALRRLERAGGWDAASEVSFSDWGERGVIDLLGWHAGTRTLLVVELKTEIVDVGRLIGQVDRYRRLAPVAARSRGWVPARVDAWVAVTDTRANRARLAGSRATLRTALPDDGRSIAGWLAGPYRPLAALSFLSDVQAVHRTFVADRHTRARGLSGGAPPGPRGAAP